MQYTRQNSSKMVKTTKILSFTVGIFYLYMTIFLRLFVYKMYNISSVREEGGEHFSGFVFNLKRNLNLKWYY